MNKQRRYGLIAACIGALGSFLPWVSVPIIGSVSGIEGSDGFMNIALFGAAGVLCLKGSSVTNAVLVKKERIIISVLAGIAGLIGLWKIIDVNSAKSELGDNVFAQALGSNTHVGIGLYIIVAAGAALPILMLKLTAEGKSKPAKNTNKTQV